MRVLLDECVPCTLRKEKAQRAVFLRPIQQKWAGSHIFRADFASAVISILYFSNMAFSVFALYKMGDKILVALKNLWSNPVMMILFTSTYGSVAVYPMMFIFCLIRQRESINTGFLVRTGIAPVQSALRTVAVGGPIGPWAGFWTLMAVIWIFSWAGLSSFAIALAFYFPVPPDATRLLAFLAMISVAGAIFVGSCALYYRRRILKASATALLLVFD